MRPLAVLLLAWVALAQTDTATITGLVVEVSQAVLPGAAIEITNRATGLKYRAHIDFQMQLGSMSEVVEVSGRAPLLQSEISLLSQGIENASIINMPRNGRNYQQLALLAPGVLPIRTTNFVTDAFSVNGANMLQNQFVMDGADNTNNLHAVVIASNQVVKPSIDAIQEFKMETHNLSAQFGRGGGGVIQVTTRSGTNNFHGTRFEFFRNGKLHANSFFNSGNRKPPYRQNQYGATFGGPIKKDRTFFFGSWQGTKIRERLTLLNVIPTPAMIGGEFTTPIYDPATQGAAGNRAPFAGNRIPVSGIDPDAAAGRISSTATSARQIQFGLKVRY